MILGTYELDRDLADKVARLADKVFTKHRFRVRITDKQKE